MAKIVCSSGPGLAIYRSGGGNLQKSKRAVGEKCPIGSDLGTNFRQTCRQNLDKEMIRLGLFYPVRAPSLSTK